MCENDKIWSQGPVKHTDTTEYHPDLVPGEVYVWDGEPRHPPPRQRVVEVVRDDDGAAGVLATKYKTTSRPCSILSCIYSVIFNIHPAGCLRSLWCSPRAGSPACTRRGWCRPSPPPQGWSWTLPFNMGLAMVNYVTICIHLASSRAALIPSRVTLYFCLTSIFILLSESELKFCAWQHISLATRMNIRMLLTMLDILFD